MATLALPTRVKITIRDVWTKEDSELQKAIKALEELVGYSVTLDPEWELLWTEMKANFPDPGTFVPSIASIVTAWCISLTELAGNEDNAEWVDEILEKLKRTAAIKIVLEVGDGRPATRWSERQNAFEISFPKSAPPRSSTMIPTFHSSLLSIFKPPEKSSDDFGGAVVTEGTWDDIDPSDLDGASIFTPAATGQMRPKAATAERLPDIKSLDRPEFLLLQPPYFLMMQYRGNEIYIQCSHQASLELMAEYFKRWTKKNHQKVNKPPAAAIKLEESAFGLGLIYTQLRITLDDHDYQHHISPTLVLAFIEGILGYRMIHGDSVSWTFRRDTALRH